METTGRLFKVKGSQNWYATYWHKGQRFRETTGTADEGEANRFLKNRLKELGADSLGLKKFVGPSSDRITVGELLDDLRVRMELKKLRGLKQAISHIQRAKESFAYVRARDVTNGMVEGWLQSQLKKKDAYSPATLNRTVQVLSQALALAVERGQLATAPKLTKLSELGYERRGFFEASEFEAILPHLPGYLKDFARFGYLTGWRSGAIKSLRWSDVDLNARVLRLRPEHDKKGTGQVLALEGELLAIVQRRHEKRSVRTASVGELALHVFHRNGRKIGDFRKVWASALKAAGIEGRTFHDFRRTAARNLVRSGVSEGVAMATTGHKTRDIFDRYNIVSETDLRDAQKKLQAYLKAQPEKVVTLQPPASLNQSTEDTSSDPSASAQA